MPRTRLIHFFEMTATVAGASRDHVLHTFPFAYRAMGKSTRAALKEFADAASEACRERGWTFAGYTHTPEWDHLALDADEWY